ncbi:putative ribonuclease H-like domain-containing protein [Tanacetum coccineum]
MELAARRNMTLIEADEGFFVGYSLNSKAFKVFNSRTRMVEENLHIRFNESTPNVVDSTQASDNACQARKETEPEGPKKEFMHERSSWIELTIEGDSIIQDERGIVVRNKARLVAQGYTQEEGIEYDEAFAHVARIENLKILCLTDPYFSDRVYKVEKALYGLHQSPRAWYETLSTYLLDNEFQRGKINKTLYIKRHKGDILLVQVYVDDIIFGSTKKELCNAFEKLIHEKFQIEFYGRELTFFLGLQVQQKKDGIFISGDGKEVDVHMYRSMIGSLMYLTSSRPDIMFAMCACARYQVNPKVSHLHAVKRIFSCKEKQDSGVQIHKKLNMWVMLHVVVDKCFGFRINYLIMGMDISQKGQKRSKTDKNQARNGKSAKKRSRRRIFL